MLFLVYLLTWTTPTIVPTFIDAFQPPPICYRHRLSPNPLQQIPFITAIRSTTVSAVLGPTSFLSHVTLKVPSVDASVKYWTEDMGGTFGASLELPDHDVSEDKLLFASVKLGCSNSNSRTADKDPASTPCFAIELLQSTVENYSIGNMISYIGVSMLLQFQNNLLGVITGSDKPRPQPDEPNGISVQSSASAPGDFFARLALKSNNLTETFQFYTDLLGMDCKAQDEKMICLRYENDCFPSGVPTTLVFEATTDEILPGDCFTHLAITTSASITEIADQLKIAGCELLMKPTEMIEKHHIIVVDPNGYKVVVSGEK
ncbi:glyoxalase/bleomycin resistance protein/dioxygenase [Nitzschia inconspicua]|uniref:Glyoxalase/bleomycin resistance protein/dioxygenase n=1 Tax=Nitzschia inconspicua TaxID=303405 RepID=A0A9K3L2K5_9STRA|nr:glyoxalase/bleomycin resistance protein/dioxygenase [Nitzschia inconspicua]